MGSLQDRLGIETMGAAERQLRSLAAAAGYPSLYATARGARIHRMSIRYWLHRGRIPRDMPLARLASALACDVGVLAPIFEGAREVFFAKTGLGRAR